MQSGARVRLYNNVCPNLPLPFDSVLDTNDRLYVSCTLNSSIEHFDAMGGARVLLRIGLDGREKPLDHASHLFHRAR